MPQIMDMTFSMTNQRKYEEVNKEQVFKDKNETLFDS